MNFEKILSEAEIQIKKNDLKINFCFKFARMCEVSVYPNRFSTPG